jgi:uncharacterized membrane protein
MEPYLILKCLHVFSAIVWVGGGFVLMLLGTVARRTQGEAELITVLRQVAMIGPRLFLPASLATLGFGLGMVLAGGLAWDAWIVLGLGGTLATALLGQFVLKPRADLALALLPDPTRRREALRTASELFALARIDYALLFSVVALMVLKPGWGDVAVLATLGVALGTVALAPRLGRPGAAA